MRVLDIDLDFFLDNVAMDRSDNDPRLKHDEYHPWSEADVRDFLELRCGLSTTRRIPGKFVTHHRDAFVWWHGLIKAKRLKPPFEVVHVDAHADLGGGTFGYSKLFLGEELLHLPLEERADAAEASNKMDSGNYLVTAIACRWVSRLEYVMNPKNFLKDCEEWLYDPNGNGFDIALPKLQKRKPGFFPGMTLSVLEHEPTIPFCPTIAEKVSYGGAFDFMLLCQSPAFTPSSADQLIPVIMEYMDLGAESLPKHD